MLLVNCSGKVYKADISNIQSLRDQIGSDFDDLIRKMNKRRNELLDELDEKVNELLLDQKETDELISDYEYELSRDEFKSEFSKSIHEDTQKQKIQKLKKLYHHRTKHHMIHYEWDSDMVQDFSKLGKIELKEVNYHNKTTPIIESSKRGSKSGEIQPRGVTVDDKSNNIFIADYWNDRVQVFASNGKYLYKFGDNEPGKMNRPHGIVIYGDKVYVSQFDGKRVNVYDIKGNYIDQFGNHGIQSEAMSRPTGLTVSHKNGDIYVCDLDKDVVFVYTNELKYKVSFGKSKLYRPLDIALTQDRIYILDEGNPCVHIFNTDLSYLHSIVSRGSDGQVGYSYFFTLDIESNILISDLESHVINVFTDEGELIDEIGKGSDIFYYPRGIVIDIMNRIFVVDNKEEGSLKIF